MSPRPSSIDELTAFTMHDDRIARQDEFEVQVMLEMKQITDNVPEIILPLLEPLYEQFHFFRLTMDHVTQALTSPIV